MPQDREVSSIEYQICFSIQKRDIMDDYPDVRYVHRVGLTPIIPRVGEMITVPGYQANTSYTAEVTSVEHQLRPDGPAMIHEILVVAKESR